MQHSFVRQLTCLALLFFWSVCCRSQTITTQKGLTTAVFNTLSGKIKVYVPNDIWPGETISGRIIAEPVGKNARQTENNLAELKKYSIRISSEKFSVDNDKLFQFLLHSDRPMSPIELINVSGIKTGELTIPSVPQKNQKSSPGQCMIPSHALTGSPLQITGTFDGDASNTKCSLDNKPLEVLAESPRQCIVLYPSDAKGIQMLSVEEKNQPCLQKVSGVQMQVSAGKLSLLKGEKTYIDVSITGLQNLPDTALLRLDNITTNVVVMQPMNHVVIPLAPDSVGSGIFNKRFTIQSIKTGDFTVNVNLDLPDQNETTDHPPTTTEQPKCECHADCAIEVAETRKGEVFFAIKLTAECKGNCYVDKITYKWHIGESGKDVAEIDGLDFTKFVTVKLKKPGAYTIYLSGTVTCSDGSMCEFHCSLEQTNHPPTTTEQPKCECHADCAIEVAETRKGEVFFAIKLTAECKGNCYVDKITYKWHIGESGKDVAEIDGLDFTKFVTVKLKKPGAYTIYLGGTVTCSDGSMCEFHCALEQTVPEEPTTGEPICTLVPEELAEPKMDGNLKAGFAGIQKIKRDEFIALGAEGLDYDELKWTCIPSPDCGKENSQKTILLNSRVKFKWECREGEGSFLKLGCLPQNHLTDSGNYVIYKPPYLQLPTVLEDTSKTVTIKLSVIDDNPTQPLDDTMYHTITIVIKRSKKSPDEYTIEIKRDEYKLPISIVPAPVENICKTDGPFWTVEKVLETPVIELPEVLDKDKMVTGQWIILKAKDQRDIDRVRINCVSDKCKNPPPWEKNYEDNVAWEWQPVKEGGRYIDGDAKGMAFGQYIIYEAPKDFDIKKEMLEVTIRVKIKNPDGSKKTDDEKEGKIMLKIYRGGVKLSYPPITWLPEENNDVDLTSSLMYKDGSKWIPALAHMGRIHFFELMNVSEEKGVCMNYPVPKDANECRDLILKNEKGIEAFNDMTDPLKCTLKEQYQQARTREPVKTYTITVHSQDYGSYGLLRCVANVYTVEKEEVKIKIEDGPVYTQIPSTNDDVKHPLKRLLKHYPDARVSIPQDIDGNHIADNGWTAADGIRMDDPLVAKSDDDELPKGDDFKGDGLSAYEEYRGFKILGTVVPKEILVEVSGPGKVKVAPVEKHVRTNYKKKDIFIDNPEGLPLWLYAKVTDLAVHEINESQYDDFKTRVINANFNKATHVVDQKGLNLFTSIHDPLLHGKCWTPSNVPAPPNWVDSVVIYLDNVKKDCVEKKLNFEMKKASVVAHELCHGNNVCHHGESEPGNAASYDKKQGLRSGDIKCVMRYDNMGEIVIPGYSPEAIGDILCKSKNGTGYNIKLIKKNNKEKQVDDNFGETAFNRGDCIHQFRVSGRGVQPGPCGNRALKKK